jgi:pimeloyl-ACP methyl ester carboxylesterase
MITLLVLMLIGLCFYLRQLMPSSKHKFPYNPIIFVHGGSGSGGQFESQAMRFTSNGYPQDHINVLEYDSSFTINTMADVWNRLDLLIAELQQEFGVDQVDILGHSLGTTVMHGYLAFPERAAKVAHYVNIDGRWPPRLGRYPPCLMGRTDRSWSPDRQGLNVTIPHDPYRRATCAESFSYVQLLTGKDLKPRRFASPG